MLYRTVPLLQNCTAPCAVSFGFDLPARPFSLGYPRVGVSFRLGCYFLSNETNSVPPQCHAQRSSFRRRCPFKRRRSATDAFRVGNCPFFHRHHRRSAHALPRTASHSTNASVLRPHYQHPKPHGQVRRSSRATLWFLATGSPVCSAGARTASRMKRRCLATRPHPLASP